MGNLPRRIRSLLAAGAIGLAVPGIAGTPGITGTLGITGTASAQTVAARTVAARTVAARPWPPHASPS